MDATDLCHLSAVEAADLVRRRRLSPVDLVAAVIARIEALEPRLNAFATFTPESALDGARAAEAAVAADRDLGPLHGVPFTVKDLADVEGLPTRRGSRTSPVRPAAVDSPFVARLRAAGAIPLGKTTTSEFGWKGVSECPLTGVTHNPWRHGANAGASSAGAGAAAAAGYGPLHQGSDGAGSIRMPAHFCGVFGLKPSYGRIPTVPVGNNDQTSHLGPLTRGVADAALMLGVMAGPDAGDHHTLEAAPAIESADLAPGIEGLRVAWSPDLGHARVDPEVAELAADGARAFASLGARVEEVTPPWGPLGPDLIRFFWPVHELPLRPLLGEWEAEMDPGLVACIRDVGEPSAATYLEMRQHKLDYVAAIHRWFADFDLLLTPAVSVAAFPADRLRPAPWPEHAWDWLAWAEFSYPFNMSHNPAASVPCGFTADGLPVGLQIVGRRLDDAGVLRASAAFERACPWAGRRPPLD